MRGKKAKMMRRIVARVLGTDFRAREYEDAPRQSIRENAGTPLRLAAGSARQAYVRAKGSVRKRGLARLLGLDK